MSMDHAETRMVIRAKEQGFTLAAYHGNKRNADIMEFEARQPVSGAKGVYLATKPERANAFSDMTSLVRRARSIRKLVRGEIASREHVPSAL